MLHARARAVTLRNAVLGLLLLASALLALRLVSLEAALLLLVVAASTWLVAPLAARLASPLGLVALPGGREGNRRRLPRSGGVALLLALALPVLLALLATGALATPITDLLREGHAHAASIRLSSLLGACAVLAIAGVLHDRRPLRAPLGLLLEASGGLLLAAGGWRLPSLAGPLALDPTCDLLLWGLPVAWVLLCNRALRWVDSLDGLCAGLCLLASVLLLLAGATPLAPLLLAGASLGLLGPTLPPARALPGSAACGVLGVLLAAATLSLPEPADPVLALALLAYPLGDLAVTLVRRTLRAKPLWAPDRSHVHHKLAQWLRSRRMALLAVLAFATLLGALALVPGGLAALVAALVAWALLLALLLRVTGEPLLHMWRHRADFRRLHLVRPWITQMLLLSRREREAREALRRMAVDLSLCWLDVPELGRLHEAPPARPAPPGAVEVRVTLPNGTASFGHLPSGLPALDRDLRGLVGDVLRLASTRLAVLRHTRTPPPGLHPQPDTP